MHCEKINYINGASSRFIPAYRARMTGAYTVQCIKILLVVGQGSLDWEPVRVRDVRALSANTPMDVRILKDGLFAWRSQQACECVRVHARAWHASHPFTRVHTHAAAANKCVLR